MNLLINLDILKYIIQWQVIKAKERFSRNVNQISDLDYLLILVGGGGLLAGCLIINNSLSKKQK